MLLVPRFSRHVHARGFSAAHCEFCDGLPGCSAICIVGHGTAGIEVCGGMFGALQAVADGSVR